MFVFTKKIPDGKFIHSHKVGHLIQEPSICVCEIEFHTNNYRDALFTEHSIQFPEKLFAAVAKRRSEYLCGRISAQTLLTEKQIYTQVTQSTEGVPIWPDGWLGSISHTEHCAIAVIAPQNNCDILGVDIENFNPEVLEEIAGTITQESERKRLAKSEIGYNTALHIAFSAKESFYKALYPQVRKVFGFESAIITDIDTHNQTFNIQLSHALTPALSARFQRTGYYQLDKYKVVTIIY
ncbi:4-phosphopantetheinyl transferase [Salmonella enterica subsp. enterica serovar Berlin]|nr:4'-phosphopantetheinyl transferase superfamily protein [Salmonella enterica]EBO9655410.1 4'-phosphopantetheinyl transferase superfamily protein [Salmonella enterica]EBX4721335.1 4-phosphopantetheinyl transferase [Salmonella enterica subsp. enterica serovar Rubislaw]EBX7465916.1 4-phosphopantetheinyl transferase [Salmonella enterica subsp. enterica serovar Bareilly]EBY0803647.1 4-phosphopantetheinyl transferase [Salmonella enterica subsp. enterica serovar Berlin]